MATRKPKAVASIKPTRPSTEAYPQLPITAFADWDRVWQIRNMLVAFEGGQDMRGAAMFVDSMLRDDRINGCTSTRVGAVVCAAWDFKGADSRRKSAKIAEKLGGSDDEPGLWDRICPPAVEADLYFWGMMIGVGVAEVVWDTTDPENWIPTMRQWHPQFLRWDQRLERFWLLTAEGEILLPKIDDEINSDGRWILWCPYGYRNSWRRALLRPLAMLYLCRQWTYRDWARYSEKHGSPADKVKVPENAPDDEKSAFKTQMANRGSDNTILLPQGGEGEPGWDVEILEAQSKSWESFKEFLAKLEVSIAVVLLGQNLSTEVQEGSRAAAQVQEAVRLDKRREDAALAKCLREQLLYWWAKHNYEDPELAPRVKKDVEPPEDLKAGADTLKVVGDAIQSLSAATVPVNIREIADYYGVPMLTEEEIAEQEAEKQAAAGVPTAGEGDTVQVDGVDGNPTPEELAAIKAQLEQDHPGAEITGLTAKPEKPSSTDDPPTPSVVQPAGVPRTDDDADAPAVDGDMHDEDLER